ncbi:LCM-domain-containing protein [Nadsonia fulvescens var. elongata DSM 6958]|uniref:tRNA wybutosine-synthesizing protein 4 n=1 Tax=Nadsonia fulvescens var. elongata DSM 6958 TaxID=857566 RepID=A0A1E3PPQ3_9ASCO|nr:LCM-domain-containing protein [Nadsonia fulvescens var. elongata DSM 6958]
MTEAQSKKKVASLSAKLKKKIIEDECIQGTNNSSIASKRSVEILYWNKTSLEGQKPLEFFSYFVKKPLRRSPAINRGYWIRVEAMCHIIEKTIQESGAKKTVIVNLGCGFDPYPFQYLYQPNHKENIIFVDVDYPELMMKKVNTIRQSPELRNIVGEEDTTNLPVGVSMKCKNYIALSCDLRELEKFESQLLSLNLLDDSVILFTAEVSITYMFKEAADMVIEWAASLPNSRFALLEQILPVGEDYPFAKAMLKHFSKLSSPLHSVRSYPLMSDQKNRFLSRGWKNVGTSDLNDFWERYISTEKKNFVKSVEDFDEEEEFAIFGQHYIILHASNNNESSPFIDKVNPHSETESISIKASLIELPETHRKFAAGAVIDNGINSGLLLHGGSGQSRLNTSLLLTDETQAFNIPSGDLTARMCHSLTSLPNGDIILIGGRTAPSRGLSDCWLLSKGTWERVQNLPEPRFRHSAISIGDGRVLVLGGTKSSEASKWIIWERKTGWSNVSCNNAEIPMISSALAWNSENKFGVVIGGELEDCTVSDNVYRFTFEDDAIECFEVPVLSKSLVKRYGAKALFTTENEVFIAGGISPFETFGASTVFALLNVKDGSIVSLSLPEEIQKKLPLTIGFNMDIYKGDVIVYGGGGVCYSFGSVWNDILVLHFADSIKSVHCLS